MIVEVATAIRRRLIKVVVLLLMCQHPATKLLLGSFALEGEEPA